MPDSSENLHLYRSKFGETFKLLTEYFFFFELPEDEVINLENKKCRMKNFWSDNAYMLEYSSRTGK